MVGLLAKLFAFFVGIILVILLILNVTNVWDPGTLSVTAPDKAPCERWLAANRADRRVELSQVRWVMTAENYGWGCYFEYGDFEVETVTPMPEI